MYCGLCQAYQFSKIFLFGPWLESYKCKDIDSFQKLYLSYIIRVPNKNFHLNHSLSIQVCVLFSYVQMMSTINSKYIFTPFEYPCTVAINFWKPSLFQRLPRINRLISSTAVSRGKVLRYQHKKLSFEYKIIILQKFIFIVINRQKLQKNYKNSTIPIV